MIKITLLVLLAVALLAGSAILWQHVRYLELRRGVIQDRQAVFHSPKAFHTLTFLALSPGTDVVDEVRALRRATQGSEAEWIYAGKVVLSPLHSEQIGVKAWNAVVLLEYPSREAYERHTESAEWKRARERYEEVYTQGFQRSRGLSAVFPQILLAVRARQLVTGAPSLFPFVRAQSTENFPEAPDFAARLLEEREFGTDAVVVVNLLRDGTPEQQAADRSYGASLFGAMAEGAYGPQHVGRAVRVERDYDFDQIAMVYYPGRKFFGDMVLSEYYQAIYSNKQLSDSQAVITAPILDHVEDDSRWKSNEDETKDENENHGAVRDRAPDPSGRNAHRGPDRARLGPACEQSYQRSERSIWNSAPSVAITLCPLGCSIRTASTSSSPGSSYMMRLPEETAISLVRRSAFR